MSSTMKVFEYRERIAVDALVLAERPVPAPGPNQLLVRVHAVSLNYRDLAIARGTYGGYGVPLVPCSDAAGEVVAHGAAVTRFSVGDRVMPHYVPDWVDGPLRADRSRRRLGGSLDGVLAEYVLVHEEAAVRVPAHLSFVQAATLPVAGLSAWQVLVSDFGVRAGDVVAVAGTGGVSLFVVQLARAAGAIPIVLGRDAERLERVAGLGARTIDTSLRPDWDAALLALTDEAGVDLFVDVLGGAALARAIAATRVGGTVSVFGFVQGVEATLDLVHTIRRAVTLRASSGGSRASFEALVRAIEAQAIVPIVDRVHPFSEAGAHAAFAQLEHGRPYGKVVIDVSLTQADSQRVTHE